MNKTPAEAAEFFKAIQAIQKPIDSEIIFFVSAVNAPAASEYLNNSEVQWGPQNIFPAAKGAFTGETSPEVMKGLGATYTLIGHSERRALFHESDEDTNRKIQSAQEFGLKSVLCIGETLEERKQGRTLEVLNRQLIAGLSSIELSNNIHIAYEPVWAIGTGEVASVEQVSEAHRFIRKFLSEKYPENFQSVEILYGGSVKPENAMELSQADEVSGFLVGGASLKVDSFTNIIKAVKG